MKIKDIIKSLCIALLVVGSIGYVNGQKMKRNRPKSEEKEVLRIINEFRVSRGEDPLKYNRRLSRVARRSIMVSARKGVVGHYNPARTAENTLSFTIGYKPEKSVAQKSFDLWKGSKGHKRNMLVPKYSKVGVAGVYKDGKIYYSTVFTIGKLPLVYLRY